jgi:stearoyl-CoA desaturase (delta-9 desaturase)
MNIFESNLIKVKGIFLVNLLLSLAYISVYGISITQAMYSFAVFFVMNCLGVTITYHRYYSHNSFSFKNKTIKILCVLSGMLSCSGSVLGWVGIHRSHHKHSDTEHDPHQAARGIISMVSIDYKYAPSSKMLVDLLKSKFILFTHRYYFAFAFVYCLVLYALFGLEGLVFGFSLPAFATLFSEGFTNYINHKNNNKHEATNVWWMNFFSFGDGWHKNHHDNPKSFTTSNKWYEIDLSGIVIKYIVGKI